MNILLVHNFYRFFGGEDRSVQDLADLLSKKGHSVHIYAKYSGEPTDTLHRYCVVKDAYYSRHTKTEVMDIIREFKPDVAHVHNIYPLISPSIYDVLFENGIPVVQTVHNYRFICPNGLMFTKDKICTSCLDKNSYYQCGLNQCFHNSYVQSFWYSDIIARAYKKGVFHKIGAFVVYNQFMKDLMIQKGFSPEKLYIIPGFTPGDMDPPSFEKDDYIAYVGRLSREKGIMTLIKAAAQLKDIKFKIIGEGPLREEILDSINREGADNINLCGFKEGVEKNSLISRANAVVVPSECWETFGMTAVEAFSMGTPVIASRLGGLKDIITEGWNGFFFREQNYFELIEKILHIMHGRHNNPDFSRNAYDTFVKNYSPDAFYSRLIILYECMMK